MQIDTNGGSSETGTKVLATNPYGVPPIRAHTATTPLGKCANVRRKSAPSTEASAAAAP